MTDTSARPVLCARPNCGTPVEARGLCLRHYLQAWRNADLPPLVVRTLSPCGTYGGYQTHQRLGEPTCVPCRRANNDYNAAHAHRTRHLGAALASAQTLVARMAPEQLDAAQAGGLTCFPPEVRAAVAGWLRPWAASR